MASKAMARGRRASAGLLVPVGVLVLRVRRRADDDAHDRASRGDLRAAPPVKRRRKPKPRPASLLDVARSGARSARAAAVCGGRGSRARLRHRASRALPGAVQGDQPRRRAGGVAARAEGARPARLRRRARSQKWAHFSKWAMRSVERQPSRQLCAHLGLPAPDAARRCAREGTLASHSLDERARHASRGAVRQGSERHAEPQRASIALRP